MLALGSNIESEQARFDENAPLCGRQVAGGEASFCSRSCDDLGRHVLIFPGPYETYDDALARARAEGHLEGERCPVPSCST